MYKKRTKEFYWIVWLDDRKWCSEFLLIDFSPNMGNPQPAGQIRPGPMFRSGPRPTSEIVCSPARELLCDRVYGPKLSSVLKILCNLHLIPTESLDWKLSGKIIPEATIREIKTKLGPRPSWQLLVWPAGWKRLPIPVLVNPKSVSFVDSWCDHLAILSNLSCGHFIRLLRTIEWYCRFVDFSSL